MPVRKKPPNQTGGLLPAYAANPPIWLGGHPSRIYVFLYEKRAQLCRCVALRCVALRCVALRCVEKS